MLLHFGVFLWLSQGTGLRMPEPALREPEAIVAQLHARRPAPVARTVPPAPQPARQRVKPQRPAPAPLAVEDALPAVQELAALEPDAPPVAALQELVGIMPAGAAAAQAAGTQAAPAARQYRASVPPSSRLTLELDRTDAKGTEWHGVADMSWQLDGGSYTMKFDAGISVFVTRVNLLALASEGEIGEAGFAPRVATEKRRGKSQTATHFNREQGRITFSASQAAFPLADGAQDKATLPLQLAAIARADPAQFDGGIDIIVGEERGASVYSFVVVGQEELDTAMGRLATWHLARPPKPGSYNSRLDVWLAPDRGWYPVRIRNTEANGAVTTQTVTQIAVTDPGTAHAQ